MDGGGAPVIVVEELKKRYGDVQAVDGVSFSVERERFSRCWAERVGENDDG